MTVLVTGGAGFIGSHFIKYIMAKYTNYKIICVDKITYAGNLLNLQTVLNNPLFVFYKADICDKKAVFEIFKTEKPEIVVNFAAESHVDRSINEPEPFLKTNLLGTQVLLDACLDFSVKRFHQISTDEVYGDIPFASELPPFNENAPLRPGNPYSASKAAADLLVLSYYNTYNLPVTISRSSNNYGSFQFPEKLIPLSILNSLNNRPIPIYGSGKNMRDWLYVEDHCEAVDLILHNGTEGEIYNVATGRTVSNLYVVESICRITSKSTQLITFVPDRKGHDECYSIDIGKISRQLGWKPKIDFEKGIAITVDWYIKNPDFIK